MLRRQLLPAVRMTLVLTVLLGGVYPLLVTGVAQGLFGDQADGSVVTRADGTPAGSRLIGQRFTDAEGLPLPRYFQARPSAAGDGYDAMASSGSNLGPSNPDLLALVEERAAAYRELNRLPADAAVPIDAVTASASGLDPHISPANARLQTARVAAERGLDLDRVGALVDDATDDPVLGVLGERTVNVVELNLALDAEQP